MICGFTCFEINKDCCNRNWLKKKLTEKFRCRAACCYSKGVLCLSLLWFSYRQYLEDNPIGCYTHSLWANVSIIHGRCSIKERLAVGASGTIRNMFLENRYVVLVFRLALAGTFLVSSFGKLVDIEHYSVAMVYNFDILTAPIAIAFGWALPFIELACAVGLLLGLLTRLSALGITLMSTSFFITKVILLSRGVDVECGCFGAIGSTMASWSIYLDPAIFLLSATVLFSSRKSRHWASFGSRLPENWSNRLNLIW